ncbi:MAG: outer membrane beta-barrel protein [Betaproteobacteria bacterium]|jgi:opacity protein-like surface antigen|nr:outer membrane beta-barrel protein [Betaproteobacteria bacterium]
MKRSVGLLTLAVLLAAPSLAIADGIGLYIAPKLIDGYARMQDVKDVSPSGDVNRKWSDNDSTFGAALTLGYDFHQKFQIPLRADLEYAAFGNVTGKETWRSFGGKFSYKQTLKIQTLFLNAYYDFRNRSAFTPYAGGGFGLASIKANGRYETYWSYSDSYGAKSTTNFAWNIGGGVAYKVSEQFSLDLGYRFAGLGKAKTKVDEYGYVLKTRDVYMSQFLLGARFTF